MKEGINWWGMFFFVIPVITAVTIAVFIVIAEITVQVLTTMCKIMKKWR